MRSKDKQQRGMWSYVSDEDRIPQDHPLRAISAMTDAVLKDLSPRFTPLYSKYGRPSIPPEHLLRALLLQVLYSVRSERLLIEQLNYNILFRWFVGINMDDPIWHPTTFTKNRDRLLEGDIARAFFDGVVALAKAKNLMSDEHFTVDGTLIEAWAGQKSFAPKDGPPTSGDGTSNPTVNFHKTKRTNDTHESTTDPEARLFRKSSNRDARLVYMGHALMENRSGLAADARLTIASGTAEREAAIDMVDAIPGRHPATLGADKGYDTRDFVTGLRERNLTPHIAARADNIWRRSAIDKRTTRHEGYAISQRKRKRIEELFGWLKTVGGLRKTRHRGRRRVEWMFTFGLAIFNLVRIRNLLSEAA
jgi:transposase